MRLYLGLHARTITVTYTQRDRAHCKVNNPVWARDATSPEHYVRRLYPRRAEIYRAVKREVATVLTSLTDPAQCRNTLFTGPVEFTLGLVAVPRLVSEY